MENERLELQARLEELPRVRRVYWNPPESIQLVYPCIIYNYAKIDVHHADNKAYIKRRRYEITIIDRDTTSIIPEALEESFQYWAQEQVFANDNIGHWVYSIYL